MWTCGKAVAANAVMRSEEWLSDEQPMPMWLRGRAQELLFKGQGWCDFNDWYKKKSDADPPASFHKVTGIDCNGHPIWELIEKGSGKGKGGKGGKGKGVQGGQGQGGHGVDGAALGKGAAKDTKGYKDGQGTNHRLESLKSQGLKPC